MALEILNYFIWIRNFSKPDSKFFSNHNNFAFSYFCSICKYIKRFTNKGSVKESEPAVGLLREVETDTRVTLQEHSWKYGSFTRSPSKRYSFSSVVMSNGLVCDLKVPKLMPVKAFASQAWTALARWSSWLVHPD